MPQTIVRTARLQLVPLSDEHLELEVELDSDPEVMRYLTGRGRTRAEVVVAHRLRVASAHTVPGLGFWAGFARDGKLIGERVVGGESAGESAGEPDGEGPVCGEYAGGEFVGWWLLEPPGWADGTPVPGEAELGYRLLRRHWRQGLASEGSRELLRHAFVDLGLHRVFAQTMAVNAASRATMAAVGLRYVRTFHADFEDRLPGTELGEVEYAINAEQWRATNPEDSTRPPASR